MSAPWWMGQRACFQQWLLFSISDCWWRLGEPRLLAFLRANPIVQSPLQYSLSLSSQKYRQPEILEHKLWDHELRASRSETAFVLPSRVWASNHDGHGDYRLLFSFGLNVSECCFLAKSPQCFSQTSLSLFLANDRRSYVEWIEDGAPCEHRIMLLLRLTSFSEHR